MPENSINTASGNLTVNGTLTTTAGGTLDMTAAYTLGGTLATITNAGTIKTSVPTATSITPIASGLTWGGTIQYGAVAGSQTIVSGTYNNVTLSNTSGINTSGGSLTINGTFTTSAGGILSIGSNTLTLNGAVSGTGTLKGSSTSNLSIGGSSLTPSLYFDQTTPGTTNVLNSFTIQ